jgi:hypothetical protein
MIILVYWHTTAFHKLAWPARVTANVSPTTPCTAGIPVEDSWRLLISTSSNPCFITLGERLWGPAQHMDYVRPFMVAGEIPGWGEKGRTPHIMANKGLPSRETSAAISTVPSLCSLTPSSFLPLFSLASLLSRDDLQGCPAPSALLPQLCKPGGQDHTLLFLLLWSYYLPVW